MGGVMLKKRIYLDYAATTPVDARVRRAMEPYCAKEFGNPSSIHAEGNTAKKALDEARTKVARTLEAHAEEIVFTSGGTEANNLTIFGVVSALSGKRTPHLITTTIEHSSVLEPLRELERQGRAAVSFVPVEPNGIVRSEKIVAALRPHTVLVSVQYANNEIGTIQPIRKIAQGIHNFNFKTSKLRGFKTIFHVDACQAPLYLHYLVNALGVDLLTLDAHKIYGPKGVGCLYVRRGTPLAPLIFGGGQEHGLRATTENVPGIVGFAEALRIASAEREKESVHIQKLRDILCTLIRANGSISEKCNVVVNGSMERGERLPNNLNLSLPGVDTEMLTLQLDAGGIAVSTKSSCLKDEKSSYVVRALGADASHAESTLRFSLGRATTNKDIEYTVRVLAQIVEKTNS